MQTISTFAAPVIDAAAGAFSLAASRLAANPLAAKATGVASGVLWLGGAIVNEVGNAPRDMLVTASNVFCGTAGTLSIAAPLVLGQTQRNVAYSSAASWVANGTADIVCAALNTRRSVVSRLLQGASGVANMAAAGLAAASADASARNHSVKAANLGTASSVLWTVGAAASLGAEWVAARDARGPRRPARELDGAV